MNYNSFEPSSALSAYIKCFWTLEDEAHPDPPKQRIVPDGCMEMIFQYGEPFRQFTDETNFIIQPTCFVFGQITRHLDIQPIGNTNIFSVRFHPAGFIPFSTFPPEQMENRAVPLSELFEAESSDLEKKMFSLTETSLKIKCVEDFLIKRLSQPEAADLIARRSVDLIMEVNGQMSVNELSEQVRVHKRQLERRFSKLIGLSPKELSRMIRIQSVIRSLMENNYENLTEVAYESGYFDQAHFIKDFREFTGESPGRFFSNNLKMATLFAE